MFRLLAVLCVSSCLLAYAWALADVVHVGQGGVSPLGAEDELPLLVLGKRAPDGVADPDFLGRIGRLDTLLDTCPACKALASGAARGQSMSEAALVSQALPHRAVAMEETARSTRENFRFSRKLLPGDGRVGVITSRYHLARAGMIARQEGLDPLLIPAEDAWQWSAPNLRAVLREAACYWPSRWGW